MYRAIMRAMRAESDGRETSARQFMREANSWMSTSMRRYIVLSVYDEIQRDPAALNRWFPQHRRS
jgi:hypothetical protein